MTHYSGQTTVDLVFARPTALLYYYGQCHASELSLLLRYKRRSVVISACSSHPPEGKVRVADMRHDFRRMVCAACSEPSEQCCYYCRH